MDTAMPFGALIHLIYFKHLHQCEVNFSGKCAWFSPLAAWQQRLIELNGKYGFVMLRA